MKKARTISFKLGVVFTGFMLVILILCGLLTYVSQISIYEAQCETNIRSVGEYLTSLMAADGDDFVAYQNYYLEHFADVNIPVDADEYLTAETEFEDLLAKRYPGKTLGVDLEFEDLDEDVKNAHLVYTQLYWLLTFEEARKDFNLPYTYYLVMDPERHTVIYMIDGERTSRADHLEILKKNPDYLPYHHEQGDEAEFMYLCDEYYNDPEKYPMEWAAWETGEKPKGYQVWNNAWGNTYAYYTPLWIDGEKLGLVGTEIEIAAVNQEILRNTIRQILVIAAVIVCGMAVLLLYINRRYVRRISRLEANVKDYTLTKDVGVADEIRKNNKGEDEISSLSNGIVSMITEIQLHIENLTRTHRELDAANDNAAKMLDLANKDALTGIRNTTAYEHEVEKLNQRLQYENVDFGVAMIDLNNLKLLNDTYGHENGNAVIKSLSDIICQVFKHSMVFRIGGDEFVVLLENDDYRNRNALAAKFRYRLEMLQRDEKLEPWQRFSAAIGMSVYDREHDTCVEDVFKRADELMYENKKEMKSV